MEPCYECDCDAVIGMEELGIGTEEILQYVAATLSRSRLLHLISELEALLDEPSFYGCCIGEEKICPPELSEVAG